MGVKLNTTRDVFPGYVTKVFPPIPAPWFNPKQWGFAEQWLAFGNQFIDSQALFITNNVQVADALYAMSPIQQATTVATVPSETNITTAAAPPGDQVNVLYKVGHAAQHTITTLAQIVAARAITFHTTHYNKLYTGASAPDWNTDETGEVYVISHDIQKAVWLDGDIKLPYAGPADLSPSPPPRSIDDWPDLYPGQPTPDYPSGLEPDGILRELLTKEHGSLLAAYEFYY